MIPHRVNVTIHQLDNFSRHAIDPVIDALAAYDREQSLKTLVPS